LSGSAIQFFVSSHSSSSVPPQCSWNSDHRKGIEVFWVKNERLPRKGPQLGLANYLSFFET